MTHLAMLERIVSGGQTGVDRAALDVAQELGIPLGGWCPRHRIAEDASIPSCYPLAETPSTNYAERTRWNVRDSHATLVLTCGEPTGGTAFTVECAQMESKPCLVINLDNDPSTVCVADWLRAHRVGTLNVAGPRASAGPHVYAKAREFLLRLLKD